MPRYEEPEPLTTREAISQLTVEHLKPLLAVVGASGLGRKADLVERLLGTLEDPKEVRALYEGLDDVLLVAVTERRTPADIDRLADILAEVAR